MAQKSQYLTPEGKQKLDKELEYLTTVRRREVTERIRESQEGGWVTENSQYEEAKNQQAFLEGRISAIERILGNAIVVESGEPSRLIVEFGSSVDVVTEQGKKQHYQVVGSAEAAPLEGKISLESPVGRAIIGRKVGDEVEVQTPKGPIKLRIAGIA